MSDLEWALITIGGFVVVAVLLRVTARWLGPREDTRRTRLPR